MATTQIVNAAPMEIKYGVKDNGSGGIVREPEAIPQHLAKFYIHAQKGPRSPQLVVGADRTLMYGVETFNELGIYCNHQTLGSNVVNEQANSQILQRLIPEDAGPEPSIIMYLDILETEVDIYQRNQDGSLKRDALGNLTIIGTTQGHKVKWVNEFHTDITRFGKLTQIAGDQSDGNGNVSVRYPIFELKHSFIGADGNLAGLRLWAPTLMTQRVMPTKVMDKVRAYPYYMAIMKKPDARTAPRVVPTILGDQQLMVSFKPRAMDPTSNTRLYFPDVSISSYQNLTDLRYQQQFGEFSDVKVYQNNIDLVLGMFHNAEKSFIDGHSDFTEDAEDIHLFNFISGCSSDGTPYHSFVMVEAADAVVMTEYGNLLAQGGSDGSIEDVEAYELQCQAEYYRYIDPMDFYQDSARNVESVFYDTGFGRETKEAMAVVQGGRKDICVFLSTYQVGEEMQTRAQEMSLATTLLTRLRAYPESDFFGTPTIRGFIIGGSGLLRNRDWQARVPLTFEIMIKNAEYMGASNGMWKSGSFGDGSANGAIDGAPGSIVSYMTDTGDNWVPESVRNRFWDVGLNYVLNYDRRSVYFPAVRSVYDDDTSPLTGMYAVFGICTLQKILTASWREFSGVQRMTGSELADAINGFINARVKDKFDNRFIFRPRAHQSNVDVRRGYSIAVPVDMGIKGMITVHRTWIEAYRYNDLEAML